MAVLEVRHLTKSFGGVIAVDRLDFALEKGELLALIGPNGAGKTTCFNMLNGQLRPDAGSVMFAARQLVGLDPKKIWRMGVGRTFQITATFSSMTVRENVQMALLSHRRQLFKVWHAAAGRYGEAANTLLERVGMADQAERAASVLAYGDLKRLELAVALANDPELLLMDEPTAGMAPAERAELMHLIAGIVRDDGLSVLFTEHDMDVVFKHAHRIMVLNRGSLIAEGSADEVRRNKLVQEVYLGGGTMFEGDAVGGGDA
ncbi:MAG: ABC transporter ATP-binding protein [Geminicoccales bacterium]